MSILGVPLSILGLSYLTWIFYLATIAVYNAWRAKAVSKPVVILAVPILAVMVVLDFLLNIVSTVVFVELPWKKMQDGKRAWLLTQRCDYHISGGGTAAQQLIAETICKKLLNPFEIGGHCKKDIPIVVASVGTPVK